MAGSSRWSASASWGARHRTPRSNQKIGVMSGNAGIAMGLAIGVGVGVAIDNIAVGIALGMVFGLLYDRRQADDADE